MPHACGDEPLNASAVVNDLTSMPHTFRNEPFGKLARKAPFSIKINDIFFSWI